MELFCIVCFLIGGMSRDFFRLSLVTWFVVSRAILISYVVNIKKLSLELTTF